MSITKQLAMNFHINNRYLMPNDVIYLIKSFVFVETKEVTKRRKLEIIKDLDRALYSRKNHSLWVTNKSETWVFMSSYQNKRIMGANCSICGNYFNSRNKFIHCEC